MFLGTNSSGFIPGGSHWSVGIYMDTGTSNEKIYGNFISGGTVGGIYLSGGDNNQVYNNIVTGTHQASGRWSGIGILLGGFANTTPMAGTQVHNNIIQVPTGASAISISNGIVSPSAIYANIYYGGSSSPLQITNMSLSHGRPWAVTGEARSSPIQGLPMRRTKTTQCFPVRTPDARFSGSAVGANGPGRASKTKLARPPRPRQQLTRPLRPRLSLPRSRLIAVWRVTT